MFNINNKKSETTKKTSIFGKKEPAKKTCGFSKDIKKEIMKGFMEDSKKMSREDRIRREAACQNVFGMSSKQFMKNMLK